MTLWILVLLFALGTALLYFGRAYWAWTVPLALLFAWGWRAGASPWLWWPAVVLFAALALVFGVPILRRALVTPRMLRVMAPMFPDMSDTERTALDAGTVWFEAELFSGRPRWKKLLEHTPPGLTERERAFLAGEVEELCRLVDPEVVDATGDLSVAAWRFLKDKGFMGMIVPEEHGGLGFSAEANSAVVTRVSSHNVTLAVTVMVPNSLGPAELLLHYGTDAQKERWLPRLAHGSEVPAFALTEPSAGSDAGSMTSAGVVCEGEWEGESVLGVRLSWDKRYITLAPVATLLGLAFKLYDPEHLLGETEDLGITCALVPTHLAGVETGRRHDPLGVKFLNGPTTGRDVFVPMDHLIGGAAMAGQGWRMLMDCLSAGRSISLPAMACGAAQVTTRAVSAYTLVREQFGMPLARFEGIEERLAAIFGRTWLMDAARTVTAGAVASGEKPSVVSAIVKAWLTEGMRDVVNDGMDVLAGAGISRGPRNVLSRFYQTVPIGITVEGANILTRTLIVYGQGALRCHPYAFREMEAARVGDLVAFDRAFFKHVGYVFSTLARAKLLAWTGGRLARAPVPGPAGPYYRRLSRLSAAYALASEAAMATVGGALKRKERLTGRLADGLAWMYLATCALTRFRADGERPEDVPLLRWGAEHALYQVQVALDALIANLPDRRVAWLLRAAVFPLGRRFRAPADALGAELVATVLEDDEARARLTSDVHVPEGDGFGLAALDAGRLRMRDAASARRKLRDAQRAGTVSGRSETEVLEAALEKGVVDTDEAQRVRLALAAQEALIQVDAFDHAGYLARCGS